MSGRSRRRARDSPPSIDDDLVKPVCVDLDLVGDIVLEEQVINEPFKKRQKTKDVHGITIEDPFDISLSGKGSSTSVTSSDHASEDMCASTSDTQSHDSASTPGGSSCFFNPDDDIPIDQPFDDNIYGNLLIGEDTSEQLYQSSRLTVNQTLAVLFTWFSSYPGISKSAFSRLLYVLCKFVLPSNNTLPSSYEKARSSIQQFIAPVQEFDSCVKDCVVYKDDKNQCPECNEDRYEQHTDIARKRFKYIPLGPRLKRMFANKCVSKLLQDHLKKVPTMSKSTISDLHQSDAWKKRYDEDGPFKGDPRGICLSLCIDGTNPYSKNKASYSMWPIMLTILNLPFPCRIRPQSILLAGIIPGKSEPNNLDPYIGVLVDEINKLNGVELYDAYREERFVLQIDILMNIVDYPGHNKLFHCVGSGAYAGCAYCVHLGEYSEILQKIIYPGNRRFLEGTSSLRSDTTNFPSKSKDTSRSPQLKNTKYVDDANEMYSAAKSKKERIALCQKTGCKGSYVLRKLPLHERILSTPVDPMHLIKNMVSHSVNLIVGNEDSSKVRQEEKRRGRFPMSWITENSVKELPPAPFSLSKEDIVLANERAKRIRVPASFDWHPRDLFEKNIGMKSHEWMEIATEGILKFCLRGLLGRNQRTTLFKLFDVIRDICSESIKMDNISDIESRVHIVLALLERDFPVSMQVIVFHLFHHLPMFLKHYGPACMFWMFPYERFNSWIIRRVLSRRHPEATVIESYRLSEWTSFMELSEQIVKGAVSLGQCDADNCESDGNDNDCVSSDLSEDVFELLRNHYLKKFPEFGAYVKQYNKEKKQAKIHHKVRSFPAISEWVPNKQYVTPTKEFCTGPSHSGIMLKQFQYKDSHNRLIKLSSAEHETEHSYCRCSYVATQHSPVDIGRIVSLFKHTFLSVTTTFAYISLFDGPYKHPESNLLYVFASGQTQSVIPVTDLTKPLVMAYDDDETDKIWILNLK